MIRNDKNQASDSDLNLRLDHFRLASRYLERPEIVEQHAEKWGFLDDWKGLPMAAEGEEAPHLEISQVQGLQKRIDLLENRCQDAW